MRKRLTLLPVLCLAVVCIFACGRQAKPPLTEEIVQASPEETGQETEPSKEEEAAPETEPSKEEEAASETEPAKEETEPEKETEPEEEPAEESLTEEETGEDETDGEFLADQEEEEKKKTRSKKKKDPVYRSVLTGLKVDSEEEMNKRPIAVMYPIDRQAQPQYGLDRVDVMYEFMEEGDMSRQMGLITDWEDLDRIGNIRSTRDYYIKVSLEFDPVYVHYGGPIYTVSDWTTREEVDNINGVDGIMGPSFGAFFRIPEGSLSEHTAYTSGSRIKSAFEQGGYSFTRRPEYDSGRHFKFMGLNAGVNTLEQYKRVCKATEIDFSGSFPVDRPYLWYNEEDGLYYREIYGAPQRDGNTGTQLTFTNIIVLKVWADPRDSNRLMFNCFESGGGYYITRGKMIRIFWDKKDEHTPYSYTDDYGNQVEFNRGRTLICLIRRNPDEYHDTFKVNGDTYGDGYFMDDYLKDVYAARAEAEVKAQQEAEKAAEDLIRVWRRLNRRPR